jgi:hypothetical protein
MNRKRVTKHENLNFSGISSFSLHFAAGDLCSATAAKRCRLLEYAGFSNLGSRSTTGTTTAAAARAATDTAMVRRSY